MDLHSLNAFIEVSRCGSFSGAAESLFITQSAVSKRVAALETELNIALFDRIGRKVYLTDKGKKLLPMAKRLIQDVEELRLKASSFSSDVSGTLMIGTSHHIGLHRLPPVLKEFKKAYPDVQFDISFLDSEQACLAVEQGDLELAIVTLPTSVSDKLKLEHIWTDQLKFVVNKTHPLAKENSVPVRELVRYEAILPSPSTYTYRILNRALETSDLRLQIAMSTNYLETLKMLVVTGFGWSVIPHTMVDDQIVVLNTDIALERKLGLAIHKKRSLSNAALALINILRDHHPDNS